MALTNHTHTHTYAQLISRLDSLLCNFLCTLIRVVCERKAKFISVAHLSTFICVWHLFVATFCGFAVLTFYAFLHCLVSFGSTPPRSPYFCYSSAPYSLRTLRFLSVCRRGNFRFRHRRRLTTGVALICGAFLFCFSGGF